MPRRLAAGLLDALWRGYRARVPYARTYEGLVAKRKGRFVNDHVAFRTLAAAGPACGISALARPFEALGWRAAGTYDFPDKRLTSMHYRPPAPGLPKIFISELRTWELPARLRGPLLAAAARARPPLAASDLAALARPDGLSPGGRRRLLARAAASYGRPWPAPSRRLVEALEKESQFGAWVLLHGHAVNHFTAAVHEQRAPSLAGIERTVAALRRAGVPMKPDIEGGPAAPLRQSSTAAVVAPVEVREGRRRRRIPWTYAYFELAERPRRRGARFEGFLGAQAANLFEMTRRA